MSPSSSSSSSNELSSDAATGAGGSGSSYFYVRRHAAKFHVLALAWDPLLGQRLLVSGLQQVEVWGINSADLLVSDRTPLQLPAPGDAGDAGGVVSGAAWLPRSDTWVAVTTPVGVHLYDLAHSAAQPAVVIQPQGHQLLAGGVALVPRLREQQELQQQVLHAVMLTREGGLLSAEVPQRLLDGLASCAAHFPASSCASAKDKESGSSRLVQLEAQLLVWPSSMRRLQHGHSCHYLEAQQLLVVSGTAASASGGGGPQQLLLRLDAGCRQVLQACAWETHGAAAPVLGSPKPLVLSPAGVHWSLPLLPGARACYGSPQLLAAAPGQAKALQVDSGQACAYVAALTPPGSRLGGGWEAVVQPLHLRHSTAGAVVDGLAVLSFPFTQQLLLVVLCSRGNMYMFASRQLPGCAPAQPHTRLLRQQLVAHAAAAAEAPRSKQAADAAAKAAADSTAQQLTRRAAAALASSSVPSGAAASTPQPAPAVSKDEALEVFESATNMNSHLTLAGDVGRATPEAAAAALFKSATDTERRLEAADSNTGLKLVVKIGADCDLQPVGLKLLLPGSGAAPASVTVSIAEAPAAAAAAAATTAGGSNATAAARASIAALVRRSTAAAAAAAAAPSSTGGSSASRTVQLAARPGSSQRWYQVLLLPQESKAAAATGQLLLSFSAAVDADRRMGLCHMDVFGQAADVVAARAKQHCEEQQQVRLSGLAACCCALLSVHL